MDQNLSNTAMLQDLSKILDIDDAMSRLGCEDLFILATEQFSKTCQQYKNELFESLESEDTQKLIMLAHTLKGSGASISAIGVSSSALELEQAMKVGETQNLAQLVKTLSCSIDSLCELTSESGWVEKLK